MKDQLSLNDKFSIGFASVALALSLFTFVRDTFIDQNVLRASVVHIEEVGGRLHASILLVNSGKNYETLYSAKFIYSDDLSLGGGSVSKESVGPLVLKPGEAVVVKLDAAMPDIVRLREDGTIKNPRSGIHLGVIFDALTPSGELREDSRIYRVTEFLYDGAILRGRGSRKGDNDKLIDLL